MVIRHVTHVMHFTDLPGANPWLNGVAKHYDRTRFEHSVVSLGPRCELHVELEARGVRTFSLNSRERGDFPLATFRLTRLLRAEKPDILQTHLFWPSLLGLAAAQTAATPIKLVTRHHSDFTTTFDRPIHRRLDALQAKWADRVLGASHAVKRDMMRYERVPGSKIVVAHYGYDFSELRPTLSPDERRAKRDELGGDERFIVATVARLFPSKGLCYYLEALSRLAPGFPEILAVFCGTGPQRDDLEALVDELALRDSVRFLGWRGDAHRVMEASDVVVHPSLHEAFCSVIIESMALERPLIATNIAAAPEQVDDGETGILVPPRDPNAIYEAMRWVLRNRDEAAALGREARKRVNERFNFPRMMTYYEQIYDNEVALKGKGRTRPVSV